MKYRIREVQYKDHSKFYPEFEIPLGGWRDLIDYNKNRLLEFSTSEWFVNYDQALAAIEEHKRARELYHEPVAKIHEL